MAIAQNNYPNPLDNFRSYSYHHILTIANTTEAFRKMIEPVNGRARVLSEIEKVSLGGKIDLDGSSAYLLVDTRRFSQYSITQVEMEHVYGTGSPINPSVPVATTRVKLIDTTGLTFFNFLADTLRNKLKTTRASAFFLLTTIFVGHRDDGTTETVSMTNIPMLMLLMSFKFTSTGSEYEIEFLETEGAVQSGQAMEQINYLGHATQASTQGGPPTVGQMLLSLERNLNIQSLKHYQKYTNDALKSSNSTSPSTVKVGKLVQYMITLPNAAPFNWANDFTIGTAVASKREEAEFLSLRAAGDQFVKSNKSASPNSSQQNQPAGKYYEMSFSNSSTTITDAIKKILESSPQFLQLANRETIEAGNGYSFKTITNITSNDNTYLIHFDIYPVKIPKPKVQASGATGSSRTVGSGTEDDLLNLIKYDYIFTGLNSHIRELEIQYMPESAIALDTEVDIGSNRFAKNAASGNTVDAVKKTSRGKEVSTDFASMLRPSDPVFLPLLTKDQQNNNNSQSTEHMKNEDAVAAFKAKQDYTRAMANFHFLSSMNLDMTIRGNPNILRKYADRDERGGVAMHGEIIDTSSLESFAAQNATTAETGYTSLIANRLATAKAQYYSQYYGPRLTKLLEPRSSSSDSLLNGADIATAPIFVKVNIMAPNVDFSGNFIDQEPMFTDKFFYTGPYQVMTIKHQLMDGDFTQSINMIPFDITGAFTTSKDVDNNASPKTVK